MRTCIVDLQGIVERLSKKFQEVVLRVSRMVVALGCTSIGSG